MIDRTSTIKNEKTMIWVYDW